MIRDAHMDDLPALLRLARIFTTDSDLPFTFDEHRAAATLRKLIASQDVDFLVVQEDGVLLATAILVYEASYYTEIAAYIDKFFVHKELRGVGVSRELLSAYASEARGEPLTVEQILDALLRPDVEAIERLRDRAPDVARFIGRTYNSPTPEIQRFISEQFAEDRERFFEEIARALPHLSPTDIEWRMGCVVGVIIGLFSRTQPRLGPVPNPNEAVEETLTRLIDFCAPALAAPVAPRP